MYIYYSYVAIARRRGALYQLLAVKGIGKVEGVNFAPYIPLASKQYPGYSRAEVSPILELHIQLSMYIVHCIVTPFQI
jgi:hypothetical protein